MIVQNNLKKMKRRLEWAEENDRILTNFEEKGMKQINFHLISFHVFLCCLQLFQSLIHTILYHVFLHFSNSLLNLFHIMFFYIFLRLFQLISFDVYLYFF